MTEKKKDAYTHTHEDREEKEGERAALPPSCPPSSMPFQLKSAVVIKFQQGLGATVQSGDGGGRGAALTQR